MASQHTCHKHIAEGESPSIFQNGNAVFQAYHVGWIICGCFTAVATVASLWLINKHLQWYTNKREQRYIVRLLFLVPLYALISFASFLFWNNATPLILVRDAYEAIVLTAFFYLLLVYLSPDPEEQRRIFIKSGLSKTNDMAARLKGERLHKWMWPLGFIKKKPKDGLYFLQLMKWGVLQYCVIRPVTALAAVILDYTGYYCEASWSPVWGHLWIVLIISISVTVAMYCLLQLYMPVAKELKPHGVILKLFSVKAVVFLTFWQATLLAALSMVGVVKGTTYMTAEDINIGIGAILQCFEMMIFAFVHIKAFTYKPYRPFHNPLSKDPPPPRTPRLRSLGHALDFRETFREIWIGCVYMFDKMRGREPRHDHSARRAAHYEEAFGQARPPQTRQQKESASPVVEGAGRKAKQPKLSPSSDIAVRQEVEVDVAGERQWLGLGDDYGYGLGYFRRERSEGLSTQIDKELQKRGYTPGELPTHAAQSSTDHHPPIGLEKEPSSSRRDRSWWRNVYEHISPSSYRHPKDATDTSLTTPSTPFSLPRKLQGKSSRSRRGSEVHDTGPNPHNPHDLEDPPPGALLPDTSFTHEPLIPPTIHRISPSSSSGTSMQNDVLAPLNSYQERRRSQYRPKRHKRNTSSQGSASALLGMQSPDRSTQLSTISPSPPESPIDMDMAELDPRLSWPPPHDPGSLLSIPTPPNSAGYGNNPNYVRSDSLLGRIFPPSEVGSIEGRSTRMDTDSAYSLPSIVSGEGGPRPTGDMRLHVHDNIYHPSDSVNALHTPWTADILYEQGGLDVQHPYLHSKPSSEFGEPPPLPEKDFNYVPAFRRPGSGRRQSSHRNTKPRDSAASLPSLPEDTQFAMAPIHPYHHSIMKNDTARSSTLVDSPPGSPSVQSLATSLASGSRSFAERRLSQGYGHDSTSSVGVGRGSEESRMTPGGGATPPAGPGQHRLGVPRLVVPARQKGQSTSRPARKLLRAPPQSSLYSSIADDSTRPSSFASSSAAAAAAPFPAAGYPPSQGYLRQSAYQGGDRPPSIAVDAPTPTSTTSSAHRREQAQRGSVYDHGSDDDAVSDSVSVNTFYTAASQPTRSAGPRRG